VAECVKVAYLEGNNTISFDEFKEWLRHNFATLDESLGKEALKEVFDSIDADDGFDMIWQGKSKAVDNAPMILGDDFLADLKANDVVDSDDDCYFW